MTAQDEHIFIYSISANSQLAPAWKSESLSLLSQQLNAQISACPGDTQLLGHSLPQLNDCCQHAVAVEHSLTVHKSGELYVLLLVLLFHHYQGNFIDGCIAGYLIIPF